MDVILSFGWKIGAALAGLYLLVALAMYVGQRRFLYFPEATRTPPASIGLNSVAEIELVAPDGARLVAWYGPASPGKKTMLYFHGNGGSLADRVERIKAYRGYGFGLLMMSYRGYSGSTGAPSEAANVADAKRAYDWLMAKGVAAKEIVLFGESLGTGVALQVAAEKPVAGIVLDAPYTAIVDIAAEHYWFLPVRALLADAYDSKAVIAKVRAPFLVLHGALDEVVPIRMGRELFVLANEPKQFVDFPEAGHLYHLQFGSLEIVRDWINGLP